jgi:hypothetical protein
MSGRLIRQAREAKARVASLAPCSCGQWPHDFMTPCAFLASITAVEKRGFCAQCGYRFKQASGWWGRDWHCERGHSSGSERTIEYFHALAAQR